MPGLIGSPELAASGDGRLELFVVDVEGQVWHMWQTAWSNGWSGWSQTTGPGSSWPVTVAASGDGRLELFVVSGDGLQHQWQTAWSNGWSDWVSFPPPPQTFPGLGYYPPAIAPRADNRLALFAANGALWVMEQSAWSNGWSDWSLIASPSKGALLINPVAAARSGDGRIYVFVIDADGTMWGVKETGLGGPWSDPVSFGSVPGGLTERPALTRSADGRLELFAVSNDGHLWHRWQDAVGPNAPWPEWVNEGDAGVGFVDHPVVGASADGRLELFIAGRDGNIWHKWQTVASNGWSAWTPPIPRAEASAPRRDWDAAATGASSCSPSAGTETSGTSIRPSPATAGPAGSRTASRSRRFVPVRRKRAPRAGARRSAPRDRARPAPRR